MYVIKSKEEFRDKINGLVLVDFYADWCGPCKVLSPILEDIESEVTIEMVKVNTDNFMSLAREYKIMSIPSLKIFNHGKVIKEATGLMDRNQLIDFLSDYKKN